MVFFDPHFGNQLLQTGVIDLALVILGFLVGQARTLRTPIMLSMFLIRLVKWWLETHPEGKRLSKKTQLDEEFRDKFAREIAEIERTFTPVDTRGK